MNPPGAIGEFLTTSSANKRVIFAIVSAENKLLFCSPRCIERFGLSENDSVELSEKKNRTYLKGANSGAEIPVNSSFDLVWHGESARMVLLEEPNPGALKETDAENINISEPKRVIWFDFRCTADERMEMFSLGDQAEELTGIPVADLLAKPPNSYRELMPAKERRDVWQFVQAALAKGQPYQVTYSLRDVSGEVHWVQEQGKVVEEEEKNSQWLEGWAIEVTPQKLAEEALYENELFYRSLVEASPDSVLMLDSQGFILLANRQFCDLIGVKNSKAILHKNIFDFFIPYYNNANLQNIEEVFNALPESRTDLLLKLKTGVEIPVEVNFSILKGKSGKRKAYVAIARDLRQRDLTQKALRESEARYRAIVEENPEMVIRFSLNGEVTFANTALYNYIGLQQGDLIGKKVTAKMTGPGRHLLEKIISTLQPDMPAQSYEFSIHSSKWGERWLRWKTISIKDANGQFIEYQAVGEDITDQKRVQAAEIESQNRLREIMENIKLMAVILDSAGRVTFCNSHFLETTGWTREEVLNKEWVSHFVPVDYVARLKNILIDSAIKGSVPVRNENPILTRTGEERLIAWYNTLMRDSHGQYVGIASIGEDITEKHFSDKIRETILKIAQSANQSDDLDSLYRSIQNVLKELMPVDNFFIALYDPEKDILSFPYFQDEYDSPPLPARPKHGLTEYVLRTGKTLLASPEKFDELVAAGELELIGAPSIDWIGVPLKVESKIIGVMGAQTYSPGIRYGQRDEQILTFVSNQIAMVIERKRSEQALRDSQKRNELLLSASTDAIFTETMDGSILDCNDVALQMYGYTRQEMLKLNVSDLIDPEFIAQHPDYLNWEIQQGVVSDASNRRKDGETFPAEVSIRQTMLETTPVLIAYVRDLTEEKQAARVIIESEEKFRALAENSAAGIFIHSGGKNIYVNPMWNTITGYSVQELLAKKPIEFIDPQTTQEEKERLAARLMGENLPDRFEFNILTKTGEKLIIDLNLTPIKFEGRDAIMGTAIDITSRRQREHELEVIAEMSQALRISLRRMDVISTTITKVSQIMKIDGADVALFDKSARKVVLKKAVGVWEPLDEVELSVNEGLSGHIISTGRPYINHQPEKDPYFLRPDLVKGFASLAGVPLITNGETIGSLIVGSRQRFSDNDIRLLNAIGDFSASAIHRADLFEQSSQQAVELKQAYNSTLEGWALALELRDKETQGHSMRIASLTLKLAKRMGIPESQMENIRRGALLHDIGKLGVPDTILLKHGTLTADEWAVMQKHPIYAYEMLSQLKDFKDSIDIPYCHHEWWDGSGYPRGLEGKEIPLAARIFCIVDVWDALTSDRPYRSAWKKNEALAHIINQAGTHFDPDVVNEFIQMIVNDK